MSEQFRTNRLYELIDALAGRIVDCDQLIAEGNGYTYERAYNEMVKPQVQRIVEAKDHLQTGEKHRLSADVNQTA